MKTTDLVAGTKIEIELFDSNSKKIGPLFVSEFEWTEGDSIVFIAAPISEGVYYPVRLGMTMNVYFNQRAEFYKFSANLLDRSVKDNVPLLEIGITSDFERIQRRQFFRFECTVPVRYREAKYEDKVIPDKTPFFEATTRDLSGGGTCIAIKDKIENNAVIECELHLPEISIIKFLGKVVRFSDFQAKGIYKYEIGVEFLKIDTKCREAVISYIFQEQRKLMKKGLV